MTANWARRNRNPLDRLGHYVRRPSGPNFFRDIHVSRSEVEAKFARNTKLRLVFAGDHAIGGDFYAIPYQLVAVLMTDDNVTRYKGKTIWRVTIDGNDLLSVKHGKRLFGPFDVGRFRGAKLPLDGVEQSTPMSSTSRLNVGGGGTEVASSSQGATPDGVDSPARQPDPLLRQRVEQAAVEVVSGHFTGLGYRVDSVERDNVGWDLDATLNGIHLRLEVKGLSSTTPSVELTPNEYRAMGSHRDTYRLCVVTDALASARLRVFRYSPDSGRWEDEAGKALTIQEVTSARCSAQ